MTNNCKKIDFCPYLGTYNFVQNLLATKATFAHLTDFVSLSVLHFYMLNN